MGDQKTLDNWQSKTVFYILCSENQNTEIQLEVKYYEFSSVCI